MRAVRAVAVALALWQVAGAAPASGADERPTLYVARRIVTMDPEMPRATAVAVKNGRILDLGSILSVTATIGGGIKIDRTFADLVLVPGFIDNHLHPGLAAMVLPGAVVGPEDWELAGGTARGVRGRDAYRARLRAHHEALADPQEWLVAWGYHPLFHGPLSRADLDAISKTRPIAVWHGSFHEIYANGAALARWGLDEARLAGHPGVDLAAGRFHGPGLALALQALAPLILDPERYAAGLREAGRLIHRSGITTVADQGLPLIDLEAELELLQRVYGAGVPFRTLVVPNGLALGREQGDAWALARMEGLLRRSTPRVRFLRQVTLFADGAFHSQRMQMRRGYLDGRQGEWIMPPEALEAAARVYWRAGWPIQVHANGDLGVQAALDVLERLSEQHPRRSHHFTLHHLGYFTEAQARRMAELGALASANPFYLWALGDAYAENGLGPARAHHIARIGSLLRHDVPVAFHSDLSLAPPQPLTLAWVAVNRLSSGGVLMAPKERIGVGAALRAITIDAARVLQMDDEIGSITPGKRADFTVLETSPYAVSPAELRDIRIWGTVFEGRPHPID